MKARKGAGAFQAANVAAAKVILADAAKYGGPESGLVQWAKAILGRIAQRPAGSEPAPGRAA